MKDKKQDKTTEVLETSNLAAKYRPRRIEDYIGQPDVVTQVTGWLSRKKLPSTILIEGPTGSGKTTLARLLSTYINCETLDACGSCFSCKFTKSHPDYMELNMGTDSGKVDGVRALIQAADNAPMTRRKIIVLDEAHLMSNQAASALLVPTEEPGPKTLWIFCTTNPEKMLPTMIGRCKRLKLNLIDKELIVKRLNKIGRKEGHNFNEIKKGQEILSLIADFSNGHMRNAINLLDGVLGALSSGEKIDLKTVLNKYVTSTEADLEKVAVHTLCAILSNDLETTIKLIINSNNSRGLLHKMRWLVDFLVRSATGTNKYVPYSGRLFFETAKVKGLKYTLASLISIQYLLVESETKFNTLNIDESVLLQSILGNYVIQRVQYIKERSK